jgi:hypothetical protein
MHLGHEHSLIMHTYRSCMHLGFMYLGHAVTDRHKSSFAKEPIKSDIYYVLPLQVDHSSSTPLDWDVHLQIVLSTLLKPHPPLLVIVP